MKKKGEPEPLRFLRLNAVMQLTGVKKSTVYVWVKAGLFPSQHKLGTRAVAWLEHDVQAWIQSRADPSDDGLQGIS